MNDEYQSSCTEGAIATRLELTVLSGPDHLVLGDGSY